MGFINLNEINEREPVQGFKGKFIHTENLSVVYWKIKAGSQMPEHSHPHEQVTTLIEGEFELSINGETKNVSPGDVAVLQSNIKHGGNAITDCYVIDVFHPVREDYK
jgi:quercetin dioxygenase-like cupin family protein